MSAWERATPMPARTLPLIRIAWLMLALTTTAVWIGDGVVNWTRLVTVCHPDSACLPFQLDPAAAATLSSHGISLSSYGVALLATTGVQWVLWTGVATLIIFRRSNDRGAIVSAFFLVLLPMWNVTGWDSSSAVSNVVSSVCLAALLIYCLLFPDGRFEPRWTRWLAALIVVLDVLGNLPFPAALQGISAISFILIFFTVIGLQIYRYRSISSWTRRQQTNWAVFGLAVGMCGLLTIWTISATAPFPTRDGSLFSSVTNVAGFGMVLSAIPLSIGVAVMRNRLWDIDHVINRALVYSVLSVILAALYVGGVLALQGIFRLIVGSGSTLAIAISTLAIVVLFGPVRRNVQTWIDRRFYRSKYDAQRTLVAFGERVRDEVDLDQLSQGLTTVVRETLQPEHVSLWLPDGGQESRLGPDREAAAR